MMEREGVLSVHQGKEVELLCRASGDDPISISWRKGGRDLVAQPGRSYWGKGPYSSARQKLNTMDPSAQAGENFGGADLMHYPGSQV
jgi:hypothetical protein